MSAADQNHQADPTVADDSHVELGDLLSILWRRKWMILSTAALFTALALAYLYFATPYYTANTELFINPKQQDIVRRQPNLPITQGDQSMVESQVEILQSNAVLGKVFEDFNLASDPEFTDPGKLSRLMTALGINRLLKKKRDPASVALRAREKFRKAINVFRQGRSYVATIDVTTRQADKSMKIANAIAQTFLSDRSNTRARAARQASTMLGSRLSELRDRVRKSELAAQDYRQNNQIDVSQGQLVNELQLSNINTELVTSRSAAAAAKARYDYIRGTLDAGGAIDASPGAINSVVIQGLRRQHAIVAREAASLSATLLPRHPRIVQVRKQLSAIQGQIGSEINRIANAAKTRFDIANGRADTLNVELDRLKKLANTTNRSRIELAELEREAETGRQLLNTFLARAKETGEQPTLAMPNARIISPAVTPTKPSKPRKLLILALSLAAGLGAGIARALLSEHLAGSFSRAAQVAKLRETALYFARIPHLHNGDLRRQSLGSAASVEASFADIIAALTLDGTASAHRFRTAVEGLLQKLISSGERDDHAGTGRVGTGPGTGATAGNQIVLLHSANPGEGKSALALALGVAAAKAHKRVLLIDADMHDPELSRVFARNMLSDNGIDVRPGRDLLDYIVEDRDTGLNLLPLAALAILAADGAPGLATIKHRLQIQAVVELADQYDLTLIDGGIVQDDRTAQRLARIADKILLCGRANKTTQEEAGDAWHKLSPSPSQKGGIVVTMSETT